MAVWWLTGRNQPLVFQSQLILGFDMLWVHWNAVHGTHLHTLRLVKMPNAFCTAVGIDLVKILPHRNRLIRAFGFTHIAIDAFVGNHQRHDGVPCIKPVERDTAPAAPQG